MLDETDGAGADVCFDGVGGEVMMQSLRCLARGGRHLVVGFASGIEAEEVPMVSGRALCFGNFDILGVILGYLDRAVIPDADRFMPVPVPRFNAPPADLGERVQADLLELLAAGKIRPIVAGRPRSNSFRRPWRTWSRARPSGGSSSNAEAARSHC